LIPSQTWRVDRYFTVLVGASTLPLVVAARTCPVPVRIRFVSGSFTLFIPHRRHLRVSSPRPPAYGSLMVIQFLTRSRWPYCAPFGPYKPFVCFTR